MLSLPESAAAPVWYATLAEALPPIISDGNERTAIARRLLVHYLGYDLTKHVAGTLLHADASARKGLQTAIQRLARNEPIQYILGYAPFLSYDFSVTPDVLIPRPETEEMVAAILADEALSGKRILDIGTGSGCIAISLKKACPQAEVAAVDISEKALAVAKKNATTLGATVSWYQLDFLSQDLPQAQWDVIVSNPPYIPQHEKRTMATHVTDYEPSLALFVPDEAPYLFYRRIAAVGHSHLGPKGKIYVEIHASHADSIHAIFRQMGYASVTLHRDLQGRQRWIVAHSLLKPQSRRDS